MAFKEIPAALKPPDTEVPFIGYISETVLFSFMPKNRKF